MTWTHFQIRSTPQLSIESGSRRSLPSSYAKFRTLASCLMALTLTEITSPAANPIPLWFALNASIPIIICALCFINNSRPNECALHPAEPSSSPLYRSHKNYGCCPLKPAILLPQTELLCHSLVFSQAWICSCQVRHLHRRKKQITSSNLQREADKQRSPTLSRRQQRNICKTKP